MSTSAASLSKSIQALLNMPFSAPSVSLWFLLLAGAALANPIRPLANDFIAVGESPDPQTIPLYTPSILALPGGRLVAAYERGGDGRKNNAAYALIFTSDDHGKTWTQRGGLKMTHARLFAAGKSLYYFGQRGDLQIARSDDRGGTWSEQVALTKGQAWHQSACNVWHANGNVYVAFERRYRVIEAWGPSEKALVLLRAQAAADLTKAAAWTFSSELVFADIVPGVRTNEVNLPFLGIPFFKQNYPNRAPVSASSRRTMPPIGWVEPAVVQVMDPDHYWYDPTGHTFHIVARAHTGGTGFACITKVVENADGTMTMLLEHAPSGQTMMYVPFPGGHLRFHLLYDEKTKLYWLLSSQATDSMRRPDRLSVDRFDLPYNERHRMVLHFSKNLIDWCFAGLVAKTESPREARHYASMDIDGEDLVILSSSGDDRAKSAHEGNLITFHRVRNFRNLVY